ncbi:hypothetical protein V5O48_018877 [Marasmius crinis-equi]|uniref:C2H2-type domain-containing protein n=1 Tax=Marasmius crinis-equi TaxID=585013 RepID=A0ABR3EK12_9AGAR
MKRCPGCTDKFANAQSLRYHRKPRKGSIALEEALVETDRKIRKKRKKDKRKSVVNVAEILQPQASTSASVSHEHVDEPEEPQPLAFEMDPPEPVPQVTLGVSQTGRIRVQPKRFADFRPTNTKIPSVLPPRPPTPPPLPPPLPEPELPPPMPDPSRSPTPEPVEFTTAPDQFGLYRVYSAHPPRKQTRKTNLRRIPSLNRQNARSSPQISTGAHLWTRHDPHDYYGYRSGEDGEDDEEEVEEEGGVDKDESQWVDVEDDEVGEANVDSKAIRTKGFADL